jgi:hypothetical protein
MGLLDYIKANTPRATTPRVKPGKVFNEGLLNPNAYNKPAADRFKDSMFGLLGVVPGVGDAASAAESADLFNRGENFAGSMAALGALPFIPSFAGIVSKNTKPLYHGTADVFDDFDVTKTGTKQKSDWGKGAYLTPDYDQADRYRIEALKLADKARNDAYNEYERLAKGAKVVNGMIQYPDEAIAALKRFQEISRQLNNAEGGAVMKRFLSDDAKIASHYIEPGSITDPYLGDRLMSEGYDAVNIYDRIKDDKGIMDRLSEVLVMNPKKLVKE